jgi:hypothetical protein
MAKATTIRLRANAAKSCVQPYRRAFKNASRATRGLKTKPVSRFSECKNPATLVFRYGETYKSTDGSAMVWDQIDAAREVEHKLKAEGYQTSRRYDKAGNILLSAPQVSKQALLKYFMPQRALGNPPALTPDATLYTSEFPFELIRYDYLIPPTYDIENEAYARDIADSMERSGWTGRPLWGMFDEDHDWTDDRSTGDLVPEIELRTGSHRWFALGICQERGTWPANLPVGYVPVVVMRRSEVPPAVWEAWADADWYGMKELGDEGVGPKPIIQLMRAERNPDVPLYGRGATSTQFIKTNPQGKKKGRLHRIGDLVKKTALSSFTGPLSVVSKAGEIVTNPKLLEPTPITFYELWDMSVGAGKRLAVCRDLIDANTKSREYWAKHPMAKLKRRSVRSDRNPEGKPQSNPLSVDDLKQKTREALRRNQWEWEYLGIRSQTGREKTSTRVGSKLRASSVWDDGWKKRTKLAGTACFGLSNNIDAVFDSMARSGYLPSGQRLVLIGTNSPQIRGEMPEDYAVSFPDAVLVEIIGTIGAKNPAVTDRAFRYRANRNAPPGPKQCTFCGSKQDVQVGHLDGHEENNEPENLVWNCRSCNAILSHQFKKLGLGRRTRQFNPKEYKGEGAKNLKQWALAVGTAGQHKSQGSFPFVSGMDHDQAVQIIHDTPPDKRSKYNREILRLRYDAKRARLRDATAEVRYRSNGTI